MSSGLDECKVRVAEMDSNVTGFGVALLETLLEILGLSVTVANMICIHTEETHALVPAGLTRKHRKFERTNDTMMLRFILCR